MQILVIVVGIINLCLGIWASRFVELDSIRFRWPTFRQWSAYCRSLPFFKRGQALPPQAPRSAESKPEPQAPEVPASPTVADDIPSEWLAVLQNAGLQSNGFAEATGYVLRLEIGEYRKALVALEHRAICWDQSATIETVEAIAADFAQLNKQWLKKQAQVAKAITDQLAAGPRHPDRVSEMLTMLTELGSEIRRSLRLLEDLKMDSNPSEVARELRDDLTSVIQFTHRLRDHLGEAVLAILIDEQRVQQAHPSLLTDRVTAIGTRIALESKLEQWWQEPSSLNRPCSVALLDLDQFQVANRQHGTRFGEHILKSVSRLLQQQTSEKPSIPSEPFRVAGQQFLLLFPDVGPRKALSAVERLRQRLAAATFTYEDTCAKQSLSSGVVEAQPMESAAALLERLQATLRHAKGEGGNRSSLADGGDPESPTPPDYAVEKCTIALRMDKSELEVEYDWNDPANAEYVTTATTV